MEMEMEMEKRRSSPGGNGKLTATAFALLGIGILLSAFTLLGEGSFSRFGFAYLWGFTFLWAIVLGSLFFVALQHITGAVWSVVVRRVAEILASPMWLVAVLFVPVLLAVLLPGVFSLYPWTDAKTVAADALLHGKEAYLNVSFFVFRAAVFFALWIGFARYFVGKSLQQDRGEAGAAATVGMRKASAPFIMIFAATATLAGIDWVMSLSPRWFSTIFGVYVFSGMVATALAAITITTIVLRSSGRLGEDVVTDEHLYNLGALMFTFVCFWAYIAFSQYMLIWYANIPEESFYMVHRLEGGWLGVSVALALVRFAVPFLVLLSRRAKMSPRVLTAISVLILGGQLLDLYWLIMPEYHRTGPVLGWQEIGPTLLVVGLLMLYVAHFLRRHAPVAVGDPLLRESRRFHL